MDNIWIILLIVGAVISLTQKNTKRRPQTDSDEEEQPRDVLQKHLEEIFGRGEEHPAAPRPSHAHASAARAQTLSRLCRYSACDAPCGTKYSIAATERRAEKTYTQHGGDICTRHVAPQPSNGTGNTQTTAAKAVRNTNTAIAQRFRRNSCTPQRQ